ncbi:MAG: DUF5107 domain-containing protein [Kiritimatiellae bacterium]|nr:DUF5107 domain-containing protein [Kiritimatiellia bacterium]
MTRAGLLAGVACGIRTLFAAATVTEGVVDLPTYPFSDPDPVPCTAAKRYPYFFFDGSAATATTQTWRCVMLENDRIRVMMMPQVGGKVWGAVDKATGREFIYFNHAVKFRNIAMRGPWCSGGIEFNFGIMGHSPTTATPVDWCVRTNADGSASCFVSATEWVNRTTWQVEVNLPADADHFRTRTTWFNGANLPGPYYQWMTAAYTARGNPELIFPGTAYVGHPGDAHPWPVDGKGRDLHVYGNNAFGGSKSYHVINGNHSYFGVWWPEAKFGSFHQSDEKFGRKIWLWALSREGGIWEDLLTDVDGQYVELQSGRMFHQPSSETYRTPFKHPTFAPGATDIFEEKWGVMRDVAAATAASAPSNLVSRPLAMPPSFDWNSAYSRYVRGEQALRERDDRTGEEALRACLRTEPCFAPALTALAGLAVRRGDYGQARDLCARALAVNTYDAEANYLDGLAADACEETATAKERLRLAGYSPLYRTAAFARLAKIALREGDWAAADELARKAMQTNSYNFDAWLVRIAAARKRGDVRAARKIVNLALDVFPLFHGARFEEKLLTAADDRTFRAHVRNELPDQTFIELGGWYEDAGLTDEAKDLFEYAANPVAKIRLAWLLHRTGDEGTAAKALEAAAMSPMAFALPFRRETRPALEWAAKAHPSWKFRYLLAVQLAAFGEDAAADKLLDTCGEADEAVLFQYRAGRRKGAAKMADLAQAQTLGDGWRVGRDLASAYLADGNADAAATLTLDYLSRFPGNDALEMLHARALCALEHFDEAVAFLEKMQVLPSEHGNNAHAIWQEAWKGVARQAVAAGDRTKADRALVRYREYPENLGLGKPFPKEE